MDNNPDRALPLRETAVDIASHLASLLREERFDAAADLIIAEGWRLAIDSPQLFGASLQALPPDIVTRRPALQVIVSYVTALRQLSMRLETARLRPLLPATADDEARSTELIWRMLLLRLRGEVYEARTLAGEIREILERPAARRPHHLQVDVSPVYVQTGASELLAGDHERALADFTRAATVLDPLPHNEIFRRDARIRTAVTNAMQGRLRLAEVQLEGARALNSPALTSTTYGGWVAGREATAEATISVERLEPDAEELLDRLDAFPTDEYWPLRLLPRLRFELARGDALAVLDDVERARHEQVVEPGTLGDQILVSSSVLAQSLLADTLAPRLTAEAAAGSSLLSTAMGRQLATSATTVADARAIRVLANSPWMAPNDRVECLLYAAWAHARVSGSVDPIAIRAARTSILQAELIRPLAMVPASIRAAAGFTPAGTDLGKKVAAMPAYPEPASFVGLTRRERVILAELSGSATLAEIAENLGVSINTVKTQTRSLYKRLNAASREEAVAIAARQAMMPNEIA